MRTGNFELTGEHFRWVDDFRIAAGDEERPEWAVLFERMTWGRFYGMPAGFVQDGNGDPRPTRRDLAACSGNTTTARRAPNADWRCASLGTAAARWKDLELHGDRARLPGQPLAWVWGQEGRCLRLGRWHEFLTAEPREANSEGGVFPAIFGTVVMTLGMTLLVVPFGVMSALYLREYAKQGWLTSAVRISINNLAGVPSIVFGVFGLGFFSYFIGGSHRRHLLRRQAAQPHLRHRRHHVGLADPGPADPAGGDRGHRRGAGRGAHQHARGQLCLRRHQVADHPAGRAAPGPARAS